jgi:3-hydroxyisobutyrate dehydrogenase-like beta-hydroxyacid dehydrogenase
VKGGGTVSVGVLHPGEMGAAIGAELKQAGHEVLWASQGRSSRTASRAAAAGLVDRHSLAELLGACTTVLSICPPGVAEEVAAAVASCRFRGLFCDCNAVSPRTAARVAELVCAGGAAAVDGGIVGPPPRSGGPGPRLYLSGMGSADVATLFAGTAVEAVELGGDPTSASTLKMLYAGWTKGSAALLLALAGAAERAELAEPLRREWEISQPSLGERLASAAADREAKGWRWVAEMEEVSRTLEELGEPPGFHAAAAEVFRR